MPYQVSYKKLAHMLGTKGGVVEARADLVLQELMGGLGLVVGLASIFLCKDSGDAAEVGLYFVTYGLFATVPAYFVSDLPRFCRWVILIFTFGFMAIAGALWLLDQKMEFVPFVFYGSLVSIAVTIQLLALRRKAKI